MSLAIAHPLPDIAGKRLPDWLRRSYAIGLLVLALSGWSPVLWRHFESPQHGARQAASAATPAVIHANYLQ